MDRSWFCARIEISYYTLKAGYLVDFDDNKMLAATIIGVIENRDEAQKLTILARDFITENLSMNARVGEYTSLYL